MKRDCPTIQELLAFDAVARCESLTLAASALCITVSAVSKQIAGLEQFLRCKLLRRSGRGVELTQRGRLYRQRITAGLRSIEAATFELRSGTADRGTLSLASVPTFLTTWLIPRLPDFRRLHPGVTFSFSQHLGVTDRMPAELDAAIRYGAGDWPGVTSEYLGGKEFVLIASPAALQKGNRIKRPIDIRGHTLLHHAEAPGAWQEWATHHSVTDLDTASGPRLAQYSALIQAVLTGLGVALVPRMLVVDALAGGLLVRPCGDTISVNQGHYLCYQPDRLEVPGFAAFRAWVLAEAAKAL